MSAAAISRSLFAALRRALVLLAALSFVLSGMSSLHTAHAMAGGHDLHASATAPPVDAASHCDSHDRQAPEAAPDGGLSCCAVACAPAVVLPALPQALIGLPGGSLFILPPVQPVLDRQLAGLFRPPRQPV
ncbi:MAG: hypothetical protein AB7F36_13275 [Reyranellaceae bacterium]